MSIERKYKKLAETALQLKQVDDAIMEALRKGDAAMEQVGLVNRSPLIFKIQTLAEWKENERVAIED